MSRLEIRGGAGDVAAQYDDMLRYAQIVDEAGDGLREAAEQIGSIGVSGDLAEAALLCPVEVAEVQAAVLAATAGPTGALALSIKLETLARVQRRAVDCYREVDELSEAATTAKEIWDGFTEATAAAPGAGADAAWLALRMARDPELRRVLSENLGALSASGIDETLYENPWLSEALTRSAPVLLQGASFGALLPMPAGPAGLRAASGGHWPTTDYEDAVAGLLSIAGLGGWLHDSGCFTVRPLPEKHEATLDDRTWLASLTKEQRELGAGREGQIGIIRLDQPGAGPSYVVKIPGTQSWDPVRGAHQVDIATNLHLMSQQERTAMESSILDAMDAAGIQAGDPVLLTGHSQGGIAAAALASDPDVTSRYNVQGVVTAGSPIGRFDIPVPVLSLEHEQDITPKLDGADNPDRSNWVTVSRELEDGAHSIGAAHGLDAYEKTAEHADAAAADGEASLSAWREQVDGRFTGTGTTTYYQIERRDK